MTSANLARLASSGQLKAEHGYRSDNRYLVFQCLQHTLGVGPEHWRVLALCHERRNAAQYEGVFDVDEKLMAELVKAADVVRLAVEALPPPT